jgi:hypothetical protein
MAVSNGDSVFLLWFTQELGNGQDDDLLIGVYRSEEDARAAIDRLKNKPGFANQPSSFEISRCEIGRDEWTEGFVLDSNHG